MTRELRSEAAMAREVEAYWATVPERVEAYWATVPERVSALATAPSLERAEEAQSESAPEGSSERQSAESMGLETAPARAQKLANCSAQEVAAE